MSLSNEAKQLFDQLPQDGGKVGGITLQRALSITKGAYQKARDELKGEGLVKVGGGRGGSLARVLGAKPKEDEVKAPSQSERLEFAREAKAAKSREQKEFDRAKELAAKWAKDKYNYEMRPGDLHYYGGHYLVAIWKGTRADVIPIPQLEWDQLNAIQR